jgi:L-alanine-DL-glutamate epimerase-like enolase superfamily enzyme
MKNIQLIKDISAKPLYARLNQPFTIATGAHSALENVLVEVTLADGTKGFGEATPAAHITGETQQGTLANIKEIAKTLRGKSACDFLEISRFLAGELADNHCAATALEAAIFDALGKQLSLPMWKFFGSSAPALKSDMTVVLGSVEEAAFAAKDIKKRGIRCYKIKLGGPKHPDFERIMAVAKAGPGIPVLLDANQAYKPSEMLALVRELKKAKVNLQLIEQPVPKPDWEGLREVTKKSGVCVCADEAVTGMESVLRIVSGGYATAVNIKTAKFGYVLGAEMSRVCKSNGIKLMMGGMMESLLAMTASAHLAAGLGGVDFVDLDTPFFVKDQIMKGNVLRGDGTYDVSKVKGGIGVTPNPVAMRVAQKALA